VTSSSEDSIDRKRFESSSERREDGTDKDSEDGNRCCVGNDLLAEEEHCPQRSGTFLYNKKKKEEK
jgi:hypothetical protein